MAKKNKKTSTIKAKKKTWIPIFAPKYFNEQKMGESYVSDSNSLIGKNVFVNLMSLTKSIKNQNINLKFEITKINGTNCYTELKQYKMIPASVKKIIRRKRDKIEESFVVESKDTFYIRVKPFILTRNKTTFKYKQALRKELINFLKTKIVNQDYASTVIDISSNRLQRQMKDVLKKIYPVRTAEIRMFKIETNKKAIKKAKLESKDFIKKKEEKKE